jgi:hypothetical protein
MERDASVWEDFAQIGLPRERMIEMMRAVISPIGPDGRIDWRALTEFELTDHHDGSREMTVRFASPQEAREVLTVLGVDVTVAVPPETYRPSNLALVDPNIRSLPDGVPVRVVVSPTVQSGVGDTR